MFNLFSKYEKRNVGGNVILLRKKTVDHEVFDYVFNEKYHRPFKPLNSNKPIILDLGANIGLTAIDFKVTYPDAIVYSYEMDKENYELAIQNCIKLENVHIFNRAIWFKNMTLNYNKNSQKDAYKLDAVANAGEKNQIEVETISIDSIVKEYEINKIEFVKMDIEGAELEIFQNKIDWLNITNQLKIEIHYGDNEFNFIQSRLQEYGFRTIKDTHHWSTIIAFKE